MDTFEYSKSALRMIIYQLHHGAYLQGREKEKDFYKRQPLLKLDDENMRFW